MSNAAVRRLGRSFVVVAAAAVLNACTDESPLGPDRGTSAESVGGTASVFVGDVGSVHQAPLPDGCGNLRVAAGSKLVLRAYAKGVQIYRWNGTTWSFEAPWAVLSADEGGRSRIGTHYAGPTWESTSGSKVVAAVVDRCTPDPDHIPWLLLQATSTEGRGIFQRVAFIQRVSTVGGNAPAAPGSFVGEEARVPYEAVYLFYRKK
jgi:Protein of unknown function (DUF3455)